MDRGRKRLIRRSIVVAGLALAGCVRFAAEDETNSTEDGGSDPESTGSEGEDPDTTDSTQDGDDDSQIDDSAFADHMEDANGWDGSLVDFRGQSEVVIENGANAPNYAFDPAGIRIDPGTTVVWEWVSDGHTVTHANGEAFGTEVANEDATFEYTFEEAGTYTYQCQPHTALGQRGTIVVGDGTSGDSREGELDEETRETLQSLAGEYYGTLSDGGFDAAVDFIHPEGPVYTDYVTSNPGVANWYENVDYGIDSTEVVDYATETAEVAVTLIINTGEEDVQESGRVTVELLDGQYLVWDDTLIDVVLEYASANAEDGSDSDSAGPGEVLEGYFNRLDNGEITDARQLVHPASFLADSWPDVEANAEWYVARDIDVGNITVEITDDQAVVAADVSFDDETEAYEFELRYDGEDWLMGTDPTTDVPPSSS
jgi:halocyanin-like protein